MEFSVTVPNLGSLSSPEAVRRLAVEAEAMGYAAIFVSDHVVMPVQLASRYPYNSSGAFSIRPGQPFLEPVATLCWLASVTRRVRLGFSVLVLPYRHPVLMTKMLATLDVLSGGRLILGAGAGWMREEFEALGADYEHRGAVTDEWVQVFKALCTQSEPRFEGRHYRVEGITMEPKPVQRPHPPVWVGGTTVPAMRRAARLGDGWQAIRLTPEQMATRVLEVEGMRREAGRGNEGFVYSLAGSLEVTERPVAEGRAPLTGSVEQVREDVERYRQAGLGHLTLGSRARSVEEALGYLRRFADGVMARV